MDTSSSVGGWGAHANSTGSGRVAAWRSLAIGVVLSGCVGVTTPASADGGGSEVDSDGGPHDSMSDDVAATECVTVDDCEGSVPLGGGCGSVAWTCLLGRCTAQCMGGRVCRQESDRCVVCSRPGAPDERSCTSDACVPASLPPRTISASCRRPIHSEIVACFGAFVRLADGTLCTVETSSNGSTWMLGCGRCQFVLGP
jgi:hypothetical protein